ncbi:MAG: tRNA (adenosine(37)-N6)-threonylcarbamoyltransferase complex transferase subunit TsaD [Candidatus Taylorbacteria bacterium]|nr:tRNA (adenosine(37)-N6)-threonylcarbamoyltransferase complex transferase subunit TsaD [Candidatus Taylorbacteria bacterium]
MKILGIETSCDETALALLEISTRDVSTCVKVLGNIVHSQIPLHSPHGGVVPMIAKREHGRNLVPLLEKLLALHSPLVKGATAQKSEMFEEAKTYLQKEPELLENFINSPWLLNKPDIDAIAVTYGPGLEPALWVGISFAKALGLIWGIPVIPTNHMEGHIVASLIPLNIKEGETFELENQTFPSLALLISGGHTELILTEASLQYKIIGQTRDDAVGEAFDKVARLLELPYPGGPYISKLADEDRKSRSEAMKWHLPRPMIHSDDYDFSFAGLKTAVLYTLRDIDKSKNLNWKQEIAREFEDAVTDVLVAKTKKAIEEFDIKTLIVGGGVIANINIRKHLALLGTENQVRVLFPTQELSTDNALMIALAGYFNLNKVKDANFIASGNLKLN